MLSSLDCTIAFVKVAGRFVVVVQIVTTALVLLNHATVIANLPVLLVDNYYSCTAVC